MRNKIGILLALLLVLSGCKAWAQYGSGNGSYGSVAAGVTPRLFVTSVVTNSLSFTGFTSANSQSVTFLNGVGAWTFQSGTRPWFQNGTNGYYQVNNGSSPVNGLWAVSNALQNNEITPNLVIINQNGVSPIFLANQGDNNLIDNNLTTNINGAITYLTQTNGQISATGTIESQWNLLASNLDIIGTLKSTRLATTAGQLQRSAAPQAAYYDQNGSGIVRSIQWIGDNSTGRGGSSCTNVHLRGWFNKGNIFTNTGSISAPSFLNNANKVTPGIAPDFDVQLSLLFSSTLATNDVIKNSRYIQSGSFTNSSSAGTSWGFLSFPMPYTNGALIVAWDTTNNAVYTNGGWAIVDAETVTNSKSGAGGGSVFPYSFLKFHALTVTNIFQTNGGAASATNFAYISLTNGPGQMIGVSGIWLGTTNAPNYLESWWPYIADFTATNTQTGAAFSTNPGAVTGSLAAGGEDLPLNEFFFATAGTKANFLDAGTTFYQTPVIPTAPFQAEFYRWWPESCAPQWNKSFQVYYNNGIFIWSGPVTNVITFYYYAP